MPGPPGRMEGVPCRGDGRKDLGSSALILHSKEWPKNLTSCWLMNGGMPAAMRSCSDDVDAGDLPVTGCSTCRCSYLDKVEPSSSYRIRRVPALR